MTEDPSYKRSQLRLPHELHAAIVAAAEGNGRSMNNEIVHRLEASLRTSVVDEQAIGVSMGLHEPEDRAAVLKVLLFGELNILRRRVAELGGRDVVLNADKHALAAQISGPRLTGTDAEKQSHFTKAVGTYPLTALLTDDELGKIAERVIQIQAAMAAAGNESGSAPAAPKPKKGKG